MGMKEFTIPDEISAETGISGSIILRSFTFGNIKELNDIRRDIKKLKSGEGQWDDEDFALLAIERILTAVIVKLPDGVETVLDLDWQIVEWLLPIVEEYSLPLARRLSSTPDTQSVSEPMTTASEKE